jgi:DNA-binding response OmpR family regulator
MYVLVISRDRNLRRLHVDNLIVRGFLAVGVASVEGGRRLLQSHSPSLVVVCQMPEIEEDVIDHIQSIPELASTPVVLSNGDPPDSEWMAERGIDAFIPFGEDMRHFIERLSPWLPSSDGQVANTSRKEE